MASNKEILEAQRFNRRRLVMAFASGTPGGREIESSSSMRPLIVGTVISFIMLGAALIMGRFSPVLPENWQNSTTIVVSSSGARYFTVEGVLRPVSNITSAKLLSEPGSYRMSRVSASTIEGISRGSRIGLDTAPDDIPAASALDSQTWAACALPSGTHTWVAEAPEGIADAQAALVRNENTVYLIVGGSRFRIDDTTNSGVLLALGLDTTTPVDVDAAWLNLFERGSDLIALDIEKIGTPVRGMPAALSTAVIGTIVEVEDGDTTRNYVITGDSTLAPLTQTAARLYRISESGAVAGTPLKAKVSDLASLTVDPTGPAAPDWPESIGRLITADSLPCATLSITEDGAGSRLAFVPGNADGKVMKENASTAPVTVRGGSGALVKASSGGDLGTVVFVSDDGLRHGLGVDPSDSLARLGWTQNDVLTIPAAWASLIPEGTELTSQAAWATVAAR